MKTFVTMKTCPKCNCTHLKNGIFCSRKCANSRVWSIEDKLKKSKANIGKIPHNKGKFKYPVIERNCLCCAEKFEIRENSNKKYCSRKCANRNSGGYREGSGRSYSGYYKGIYCGSTYELCWVIYQLDHNIKFERFPGFLESNGKKYFPDFIQNGKIIEIKGYESKESVDIKNNIAYNNNYEVIVLRKDDLKKEFEWVSRNYTKNYKSLYDEYKPKYEYVCDNCGNKFERNKVVKSSIKFCSRFCCGKGHRGRVNTKI